MRRRIDRRSTPRPRLSFKSLWSWLLQAGKMAVPPASVPSPVVERFRGGFPRPPQGCMRQ